ncbi:MAG TPA: glutaredoxin 3 [Terriglobales bacterium]|nr:glutaredoxin 3 [Terriglobales bacterium]
MAKIQIYTTPWCPYCVRAKALLKQKKVHFEEIDVSQDHERRKEMIHRSGRHTVPQIFIDDQAIGGCDELHALDAGGRLDPLLAA